MSALRATQRIVPSTQLGAPTFRRVIGSLDVRGKGTNHEIVNIGPFALLDHATVEGKGKPPFGMHPHAGLTAVTYVPTGNFRHQDNIEGVGGLNQAGGLYVVRSGRGVAHQETTDDDGVHEALQMWLIGNAEDTPRVQTRTAAEVTETKIGDVTVRVLLGSVGDAKSDVDVELDVVYAVVQIPPGAAAEVPLPEHLRNAFAFTFAGNAVVNEVELPQENLLIFEPDGKGANIAVANKSGSPAQVVVGAGGDFTRPWVKLLGENGAFILPDEETAQKFLDSYVANKERFGHEAESKE